MLILKVNISEVKKKKKATIQHLQKHVEYLGGLHLFMLFTFLCCGLSN